MARLSKVGTRIRFAVARFDGGLNTKDSPSRIDPSQTPDSLNVSFDDQGSVGTRNGSKTLNTQIIGSAPIDGQATFNGTHIVWAGGDMFRKSGTTFVTIPSAQSKFVSGVQVANKVYQGILFSSDGTNGPWKYDGSNFYNMGIDTPSAIVATQTSAGSVATGTYFYKVSFVNTQTVEGVVGSSVSVVLSSTATVGLEDIPVGSSLAGVNKRRIYRATLNTGPYRRVGEIEDNTTTVFSDTTANEEEGLESVLDGTKPVPFKSLELHEERLFFPDPTNGSLLKWTNFENPFISNVENFEPFTNRDGDDILAIVSQDGILTVFKDNKNFALITQDPSDASTWVKRLSPSNLGIIGRLAFVKTQDGVIFIGRQNGRITGAHLLTGLSLVETTDGKLRSITISEKIEKNILNSLVVSSQANISLTVFENKMFMAHTQGNDTTNKSIFWFDLNRIVSLSEKDFGSWSLWSGIPVSNWVVHDGLLYGGSSQEDGKIFQLEVKSVYNDSGSAIDSYFWTKQIGGEGDLESFIKDFRELFVWRSLEGEFNMNVRWRFDGDTTVGAVKTLSLSTAGAKFGSAIWGTAIWGATSSDKESRIPIGRSRGRRIQVRFDNQNTADQNFNVHRLEIGMNIRRPR